MITGPYEPAFVGEYDRLGPIAKTQFGENAGHVRLHGCGADEQCRRDLRIVETFGDCLQHLALTPGQFSQTGRLGRIDGELLGKPTDEPPGNRG